MLEKALKDTRKYVIINSEDKEITILDLQDKIGSDILRMHSLEPRPISTDRRRVKAMAQLRFDTPHLAAGSVIQRSFEDLILKKRKRRNRTNRMSTAMMQGTRSFSQA